jgi:hypothetical protein
MDINHIYYNSIYLLVGNKWYVFIETVSISQLISVFLILYVIYAATVIIGRLIQQQSQHRQLAIKNVAIVWTTSTTQTDLENIDDTITSTPDLDVIGIY